MTRIPTSVPRRAAVQEELVVRGEHVPDAAERPGMFACTPPDDATHYACLRCVPAEH